MKVYAAIGTQPLGIDRLSLFEVGQRDILISFADFQQPRPKMLTLLATAQSMWAKNEEHKRGLP